MKYLPERCTFFDWNFLYRKIIKDMKSTIGDQDFVVNDYLLSDATTLEPILTTTKPFSPVVPLTPSLSMTVELGLTVTYTVLYSLLFLIIYLQLCMILYYKYKRISYQSVFLFVCLIWAALRTVLFTFYFKNTREANTLSAGLYYLLYCFPVCLQFVVLSLMVLYFSQVYFKAKSRAEHNKYKFPIRLTVATSILLFSCTNLSVAIIEYTNKASGNDSSTIVLIRVVISQLLFMINIITLSIFVVKLSRLSNSKVILEAKGITVCQAALTSFSLILLFASRATYNLILMLIRYCDLASVENAPTFNFSWINVSDQADSKLVKGRLYVTFGVVLFLWEFLPTFVVVMLFRVKRPAATPNNMLETSSQSYSSRIYFFDNPRRYDSDEDLSPVANRSGSSNDQSSYSGIVDQYQYRSITPHPIYCSSLSSQDNPMLSHSAPTNVSPAMRILTNPVSLPH